MTVAAETHHFPLFLDEPTSQDLLSFDAVAGAVVDALLDESLDPIALGLSGSWGSGKTTVLRIIAAQLRELNNGNDSTLVIETDPWRYDPQIGAKESLIGEILAALAAEIDDTAEGADKARELLGKLVKRVDWGKALQVAAKAAITVQIPSIDDLTSLIKPPGEDAPIKDMVEFRAEFERLLGEPALAHLRNVVILVDDLDRCLPNTVVETLETIRLFLSVPKMSFVIAADEDRIADAISVHYPTSNEAVDGQETPARLYLHKIVQTSVPVPALSDFDTEAYLVLLQIRSSCSDDAYGQLIRAVADARRDAKPLDDVPGLANTEFQEARATALRLKPIVHEKTRGNPRRIKRFMNDLSVRLSIASRRGIKLDAAMIAKLMILEIYFEDDFEQVMDWLSENKLKENMHLLEAAAGSVAPVEPEAEDLTAALAVKPEKTPTKTAAAAKKVPDAEPKKFSDQLIRWARVAPSLSDVDIAPYLVFAASFENIFLTAKGLSERLRDIATSMLSASVADNNAVTEDMLNALSDDELRELTGYVGGVIADQPQKQSQGVRALVRMARTRESIVPKVAAALGRISPADLKPGAVLQFQSTDPATLLDALKKMVEASGSDELKSTLKVALEE